MFEFPLRIFYAIRAASTPTIFLWRDLNYIFYDFSLFFSSSNLIQFSQNFRASNTEIARLRRDNRKGRHQTRVFGHGPYYCSFSHLILYRPSHWKELMIISFSTSHPVNRVFGIFNFDVTQQLLSIMVATSSYV